jgi:hypothetical protein
MIDSKEVMEKLREGILSGLEDSWIGDCVASSAACAVDQAFQSDDVKAAIENYIITYIMSKTREIDEVHCDR